jgi:hypothetical protein
MNTISRTAVLGIVVLASALAGCAAQAPSGPQSSHERQSSSELLDNPMPCNLGSRYDAATESRRARYDAPQDADNYVPLYGAWIANESCTDSQVLAWKALRSEAGESDDICRVVYEYGAGMVWPIGCAAVEWAVTDASR